MVKGRKGFTLVEIFIVVAILGVLLAIAIPNLTAARDRVKKDMCVNNLRQLKLAKEQYALDNNKESDTIPTAADLNNYIRGGTSGSSCTVYCPLDSSNSLDNSYTIDDVATDPQCKILPGSHRL